LTARLWSEEKTQVCFFFLGFWGPAKSPLGSACAGHANALPSGTIIVGPKVAPANTERRKKRTRRQNDFKKAPRALRRRYSGASDRHAERLRRGTKREGRQRPSETLRTNGPKAHRGGAPPAHWAVPPTKRLDRTDQAEGGKNQEPRDLRVGITKTRKQNLGWPACGDMIRESSVGDKGRGIAGKKKPSRPSYQQTPPKSGKRAPDILKGRRRRRIKPERDKSRTRPRHRLATNEKSK